MVTHWAVSNQILAQLLIFFFLFTLKIKLPKWTDKGSVIMAVHGINWFECSPRSRQTFSSISSASQLNDVLWCMAWNGVTPSYQFQLALL